MLTYEAQEIQGQEAIINFLANPESGSGISRFATKTAVTTFDVQPCGADMSSLLVYVTGNIMVRFPTALSAGVILPAASSTLLLVTLLLLI